MKSLIKQFAGVVCRLLTLPALAGYWLNARLMGETVAFQGWSQAMSLLPGLTGCYVRRSFYQSVLRECPSDSQFGFGTTFSNSSASIGHGVYIGSFCSIGLATLEDDVLISSHVSILSGSRQHGTQRVDVPIRKQPGVTRRVMIGSGSWVGERAVIMADVGCHCIVGAGAVVTNPIPDYGIAVGVPASVIKYRDQQRSAQACVSLD